MDGWSVVHVLGGLGLGLFVRGPVLAMALILAYEAFEGALRRVPRGHHGKGLFEYESWRNIGYDVLFGAVGWLLAQGMRPLPLPW